MTTAGRKGQAGFGFNSTTSLLEFDSLPGTPTISTNSPRTGLYCGRVTSLVSGTASGFSIKWGSSGANEVYAQAAVRVDTLPSSSNTFMSSSVFSSATQGFSLSVNNSGAIGVRYWVSGTTYNTATTTGSFTVGTWSVIEIHVNASGTSVASYTVKQDGVQIGAGTGLTMQALSQQWFTVGMNLFGEAQTAGDMSFDDMVVNDNTGTYPGQVRVGYLFPTGDGGNHGYNTEGAVTGTSTNWQHVLDPNSTTSYIQAISATATRDTYTMGDTGLSAGSTIDCVMTYVRGMNQTAASANSQFKIETTANGTTNTSAAQAPNSAPTTPRNVVNGTFAQPGLIFYNDPAGSAWTPTTLDGATVGLIQQTSPNSTNLARVNAVWVSYTYIPAVVPVTGIISFVSNWWVP